MKERPAHALFNLLLGTLCSLAFGCNSNPPSSPPSVPIPVGAKQVAFPASDGQVVFADFYASGKGRGKSVVLMFHQAGSNAGEYATIAPQITKLGYDCLAVDQRAGGDMFGRKNRTAATSKGKKNYMDAYKDLVAATNWATKEKYEHIIAWGSSYSASLTLLLLGAAPKIERALVFSPGEYFDDKNIVKKWAAAVKVSVFFACTPDELTDGRQQIFNALGSAKLSQLVALPGGVHGSSTLIPEKSSAADAYMQKVAAFLSGER